MNIAPKIVNIVIMQRDSIYLNTHKKRKKEKDDKEFVTSHNNVILLHVSVTCTEVPPAYAILQVRPSSGVVRNFIL